MRRLRRTRRAAALCVTALLSMDGSGASEPADRHSRSSACPSGGQIVQDEAALRMALESANPGDVIRLADGTYFGEFTIARSGTRREPIVLCGSRGAVLDGEDEAEYVLHANGADWWRLVGFAVRNGRKGVVADGADHNVLSGLLVTTTFEEAIHLRTFSSDNRIVGNTVRDTGRGQPRFGEGIYIGSAHNNWCRYTDCRPDRSDRNAILGNDVARTTAESIDVKEGTTGGVIARNRFSGTGMTHADSWIDVKGNGWLVERNTGRNSPEDGIQTHIVYDGWGRRNLFRANRLVVNGPGYGIYIHEEDRSENAVRCSNVAVRAKRGLSNVRCRP